MNFETFTDNHFRDLPTAQLVQLFNWGSIKRLDNNLVERQRVFWLSQFLSGDREGALEEIKEYPPTEHFATLVLWMHLIKDIEALKGVMCYSLLYLML